MDVRGALQEQYHAGLAMLRQCVDQCPEDLWISGNHPRQFWRIAFHAAWFTHLYLGQNEASYVQWPVRREDFPELWQQPWEVEPYELPEDAKPCTRQELKEYIDFIVTLIDPTVQSLDLDTSDSGFSWYKNITKLSHQILNVRHLGTHVGQLSELLMARGIDTDWVSRRSKA